MSPRTSPRSGQVAGSGGIEKLLADNNTFGRGASSRRSLISNPTVETNLRAGRVDK